ncbi:HNH endonuclease [Bacillus thuringiensis]|uniref:HNH endonuclease n=1 Tax=Bacillus thuringiensis TaxID=1428 RepID=UPI0021D66528|nr:HNH endonuclease signature motif containing protein [Bacillus thuringiensis]MCU7666741.1 HNH endonuclease [Bacillus thuringiensis]
MTTKKKTSVSKKDGKNKKLFVPKRRRNQSIKDYLYRRNKGCCTYCQDKFELDKLCVVTKDHTWDGYIEPVHNKVITCKKCANKKKYMNHKEFFRFLYNERMKLRDEITLNYSTYAKKIFHRYQYKCIYCEFEFGFTPKRRKKQLTLDHKRSLLHHGNNDERNLASACRVHNKEKKSMSPKQYFEFLESHGRKLILKNKVTI